MGLTRPLPLAPAMRPYGANGMYGSSMATQLSTMGTQGTLFAIIQLLSTGVSRSQWQMFRKNKDARVRYASTDAGSDQRTEVIQHQALRLWNRPNDFMTGETFLEIGWQFMELVGEWYWVLDRGPSGTGIPLEMWPVRPDRMEPVPDMEKFLKGWVYTGPNGEAVPLNNSEVIQLKYPNPQDPYRGLSPVQSILADIDSARYTAEWSRNFFLNSATPGGIVQFAKRLSDDEFDEFTDRWREQHQGVARGHRVGILEQGAQWIPNTMTMRDMQFADLRKVTRDVIREAYRVHQTMLGNSDDVNRANAQTAEDVHVAWQEIPRLRRTRTALNGFYLPMFDGDNSINEFDFKDPTTPSPNEVNQELTVKSNAASVLVKAGFVAPEVLKVVGLPDMSWEAPAPAKPPAPPPGGAPAALPEGAPGDRPAATGAAARQRGLIYADAKATERLREYWSHGEGAAKIRWGEPGDFDRCVKQIREETDMADPKGYCADRHHDALGVWPGQEHKGQADIPGYVPLPTPGPVFAEPMNLAQVLRDAFRDADSDLDAERMTVLLREGLNGHSKTAEPDDDQLYENFAMTLRAAFDPKEARDPHTGEWIGIGGGEPWNQFTDSLEAHAGPDGGLTPERQALHSSIISETMAGSKPSEHPTALFLGGGPAAGKSVLLKSKPIDTGVIINPDDYKPKLPEYHQMIKAGESKGAASFVHEESSGLAKQATRQAQDEHKSYTLDGTGDSSYDKMHSKIAAARAAGHRIVGRYVTVDTNVAYQRAEKRALKSGRHVPESYLRETHASVSGVFRRLIEHGDLDEAELWDNNGATPILVASKEAGADLAVHWPDLYQKFLAKEHE
jgi:HK97 family phage portal protein